MLVSKFAICHEATKIKTLIISPETHSNSPKTIQLMVLSWRQLDIAALMQSNLVSEIDYSLLFQGCITLCSFFSRCAQQVKRGTAIIMLIGRSCYYNYLSCNHGSFFNKWFIVLESTTEHCWEQIKLQHIVSQIFNVMLLRLPLSQNFNYAYLFLLQTLLQVN